MTRTIWLASYPKSGNTWFRMLVANLSAKDGKPVDINDLPERGGIASARGPFDYLTLIDSSLLTYDEIDCLRPRVYEELARGAQDDEYDKPEDAPPVRFVKVHDAYTLTPKGEPLLAGRRGADGAIVIVRDPRDVAPSLANHNRVSIDDAITFMNDNQCRLLREAEAAAQPASPKATRLERPYCELARPDRHSGPSVRYEDMKADTPATFGRALAFAGRRGDRRGRSAARWPLPISPNCSGRNRIRDSARRRGGRAGYSSAAARPGLARRIDAPNRSRGSKTAHAPMMRRLGYELAGAMPLARAG